MTRTTSLFLLLSAAALCAEFAHAADGPQWPNVPDVPPAAGPQWPDFADPSPPIAYVAPKPVSAIEGEFGMRYWFSTGKTSKNLYDIAGNAMVSRLTYDGLQGHTFEGFGRADHTSGFYAKGYFGGGIVTKGDLNDEDFPPFINPYSSTMSDQDRGQTLYGSIDLGYNLVRLPSFRLGAYAGYHYFEEQVSAYGCTQVASNPAICAGGIPDTIRVITQDNIFHSLRVGLDADIKLSDRVLLRLDAAWLPVVSLDGADSHWLRIGTAPGDFAGAIPEDGDGHGHQLEAALSYAFSRDVSLAVGGRYWHFETSGHTHFEGNVVGMTASPQPLDWKSDIYGVFVQGTFRFGPYAAGG